MGEILDLSIKLSMLMSGNFAAKAAPAFHALEELQRKTQDLQQKSAKISGFQKQASSLQTLAGKLTIARERTAELARQKEAAGNSDRKLNAEHDRAIQQEQRLTEAYDRQKQKLEELRRALSDAGLNTEKLGTEQAKLQQKLDESSRAQSRLAEANQRYARLRQQLGWDNMKGDILSAMGTVAVLSKPVQVNKDFEQAMADVAAVARPTAEEFTALTDQAKLLGRTTQFTAMDAAHAQQNLIRSGMKASQVIEAMPSILNLSSAEGLSIDEASTIIAKGLGGMNLTAEMAPQLADAIAYASANSNTNVAMLGEAFKVAAPTLASQGVKFDQVAAYLGVLANKGYEGSEAGNALSSSFLRLARRPKQAEDALTALGVRTRTRQGKMVELPEIMRQISAAFEKRKMGENQQLEYMGNIFGGNYGAQMMAFMQAVKSGDAQSLETGVREKSSGWAAKSTRIRTDTLQGDLAGLSSAWEGLMNRIGQTLSPWVRTGVQTLTDITNGLTDIIEKTGVWGDAVITVGGALLSWKVVHTVWKYAKLAYETFLAWREVKLATQAADLLTAGTHAGTLAANMGAAASGAGTFGSVLGTLAGPLGVILGVSVLIAANWEKVTEWCQKAGEAIKSIDRTTPTVKLTPSSPDYHIRQMESIYAPTGFYDEKHAKGGILTRPHIGLVAEAGPEAIIPLTDKARGMSLLERVAGIFGVNISPAGGSEEAGNRVLGSMRDAGDRVTSFIDNSPVSSFMRDAGDRVSSFISNSPVSSFMRSAGSRVSSFASSNPVSSFLQNTASSLIHSEDNSSSSHFFQQAGDFIGQRVHHAPAVPPDSGVGAPARQTQTLTPTINITVNSAPNDDPQGLADRIAAAVQDAIRELTSYQERVAFA